MNKLFQKTNAYWAKYSEYEYRQGEDGNLYLMPKPMAVPSVYDPMKEAETLVVDALNVGRLAMKRGDESELKEAILDFVTKYGLLGFMTGLPTTPEFVEYDAVYFPKNHFIRKETMPTQDYLSLFFPFGKPDISKNKETSQWNVTSHDQADRKVLAVAMTFANEPMAVGMSLLPIYAERYDWLVTQFRDWAFMLVSSFLYYQDKENTDNVTREIYRRGVAAFGSKAPTYHVALYDNKPTIVWDFRSLMLTIQTMFGFALTDENRPLRICKSCNMAFLAENLKSVFCGHDCKNRYNVEKSRGKK